MKYSGFSRVASHGPRVTNLLVAGRWLALSAVEGSLVAVWRWLREVTDDSAYDRYARRGSRVAGHGSRLSPAAFYLHRLEHKYSRPCRCC